MCLTATDSKTLRNDWWLEGLGCVGETGEGDKEAQNLNLNRSRSQGWKCSTENIVYGSVTSFYVDR